MNSCGRQLNEIRAMLFSVIIPTYNRRDSLSLCLQHLAPKAQTISPDLFEIVITDDAFTDAPGHSLDNDLPRTRHLAGPRKGPASNRNNGAKAATGEWLVFLDDDCLPQPSFLSAYQEALTKHHDCLVFEGSTMAERPQQRMDEEAPINEHGGYLWSCNFMVKRSLFLEMGGFCELYPYACMEDVDFREQLKERKVDFKFVPQASVIHPWRSMAPDDKYLNMLLVSHATFFQRYPTLKPSFYVNFRTVARGWILGLVEAPRLGFRGFLRYFERQSTLTQFYLRIGQFGASMGSEGSHRSPISTRSGDV